EYAKAEELVGGDGAENAEITKRIFAGEKGPKRDIVVMNSAAGIYIGGKADTYKEAIEVAKNILDSGKAADKLRQFVEVTNKF
ncbi:MAG: anthranilate phosphoribosyltransferase, partial [Oscillospiraceae bacterium]|nr:anthranilate phosphoribosyltransferase [Oscillospiraceae bacterium]